jgi:hypothetical protein
VSVRAMRAAQSAPRARKNPVCESATFEFARSGIGK